MTTDVIYAPQPMGYSKIKIPYKKGAPPAILYHGTSRGNLSLIVRHGLKPRGLRDHVHLTDNLDEASFHACRHKAGPFVVTVDAMAMMADGYQFYRLEDGTWAVDAVHQKYFLIV